MAHLSAQASITVADESWHTFLDLLSEEERTAKPASELERTSGTGLDPPHNNQEPGDAQNDSEVVASSRPVDPTDKIENRRLIQKRYRAREKERMRVTQGLLAEAQKKLQHSETERRMLQARLQTYEDLMLKQSLGTIPTMPSLMEPSSEARPCSATVSASASPGDLLSALLLPTIKLTRLNGQDLHLTPQQVCQLPSANFAGLYTACIKDLGVVAKLAASKECNHIAEQQMSTKVMEASALILARAMCDPDGMAKNHDFDAHQEAQQTHSSAPVPYSVAVVRALALSDSQKDDILMLRRLFFCKLGRLIQERKALLRTMGMHDSKLAKLKGCSQRLQQNVSDQHEAYLQMLQALYFGLLTTRQSAASMLAAYPRFFGRSLFEGLALERGEPSVPAIMEHCEVDQGATWADVECYVRRLMIHNLSQHVPFLAGAACLRNPDNWQRQPLHSRMLTAS